MRKQILALGIMAACVFAACGAAGGTATTAASAAESSAAETTAAESTEMAESEAAEEEEEDYSTGDASMDNPLNQDEIGEKELLVVSFGTSFNDSRRLTIGAIEQALAEAYPEWSVRRAFTSLIIIDHVQKRDGVESVNVETALKRAVDNGVRTLVVQPTHLMNGIEYNELTDTLANYADAFETVSIGEPLLTSDEDFKAVAKAVTAATKSYDDGKTAICFMGHGTEAASNAVYGKMQELLKELGYEHYYVGTVEAEPGLEDVIAMVKEGSYEKVVLEPLMVVAGDHANNDMAGDEEGSWKTEFEKAGFEVECILKGLGENEEIRELY
ncbi:MAG: sirohydrochlorin cobaltochelatase, partial [Lachnospiraceae bacterium]